MALFELFDTLEKGIKKDLLSGREKDKALARLAKTRARYEALGGIDETGGVGAGLVERGRKLLSASPLKAEQAEKFLRHANAAWYDLSGRLGAYTWYVRCFFAATIGFFVLSPQFFGPILALIFLVPTFLGLRGLKTRSVSGFTLSAMNFPVALLAASTASRFFVPAALGNLGQAAADLAAKYPPLTIGVASVLVVVFALLSVVTIAASVAGAVVGFLNKDMFV